MVLLKFMKNKRVAYMKDIKQILDKEVYESKMVHIPMKINYQEMSNNRCFHKPVIESRLLDDMEDSSRWTLEGPGEMSFTRERYIDGTQSMRLISPTKLDRLGEVKGRYYSQCRLRRKFDGEDWREFNRLSFWVYPKLPGHRHISLWVYIRNDGEVKTPNVYWWEGAHQFHLKPEQWNHVTWEIPYIARDKVTEIYFEYRLAGNERGASETVCYDIDCLELQKVDADYYEGWEVASGRIAFCHSGYLPNASKTAIASDIEAQSFSIIDAAQGKVVYSKEIKTIVSSLGKYQVMDFSRLGVPGRYMIQAGNIISRTFMIHDNIWKNSIWKTINFFFCERCGMEIPGVHGECHGDYQCQCGDQRIVANGGWHDAGDLCQGVINSGEAAYAMFKLAEKLKSSDPELSERLLEEARWGLNWILKTSFGNGFRSVWITSSLWTDGIIGNVDDLVFDARKEAFPNFVAASAEAAAAKVLKDIDPIQAAYSLDMAKKDWQFALEELSENHVVTAAVGAMASLDLYEATGEKHYADKAVELARVIMESQERCIPDWKIPLTGFFYTSPDKAQILHYNHRSHIQALIISLATLCKLFPNHGDWIVWYSTIVFYSEYLKKTAELTQPYDMLPNAIYSVRESEDIELMMKQYPHVSMEHIATYKDQVLNGIELGDGYYLRIFPVWYMFRGNYGTLLSLAKALSTAAHLRNSMELVDLCQRQLQWIVGRNPFAQSTMFGEGYDYMKQYSQLSGDIVGSLPVGMQTWHNKDVPFWGMDNHPNYKEVWVHPSSRWLGLMEDLSGPAYVKGRVQKGLEDLLILEEKVTGSIVKVEVDGQSGAFSAEISCGQYIVHYGQLKKSINLLPGKDYYFDWATFFEYTLEQEVSAQGHVNITLKAEGYGMVKFDIRCTNLKMDEVKNEIDLRPGETYILNWKGKVISQSEPWLLVVIPNGDFSQEKEIFNFRKY